MKRINLNADMGESFYEKTVGDDARMARAVQSANVACGFHGGDPLAIKTCMEECLKNNVSLGAHPSFYDLEGFGRKEMNLSASELEAILVYQIGAVKALAQSLGSDIHHVKPHGSMNNMAARDFDMSLQICQTIKKIDPTLKLLAPALSELARAGTECGLSVIQEIYADRAYEDDGQLVSRKKEGAVLHEAEDVIVHVEKMLTSQGIMTLSGKALSCDIQSICVHGDNPKSCDVAEKLAKKLSAAGFNLLPITQV